MVFLFGDLYGVGCSYQKVENQMQQKIETEMEAAFTYGFLGVVIQKPP